MTDLIERLRSFEGSDALGNGDFSLLREAAAAIEAARAESDRWRDRYRAAIDQARGKAGQEVVDG